MERAHRRPHIELSPVLLLMIMTTLLAVGDRVVTTSAIWRIVQSTHSAVATSILLMLPTVAGVVVAPSVGFLLDKEHRASTISVIFSAAALLFMAVSAIALTVNRWEHTDLFVAGLMMALVTGAGRVNEVGVAKILPLVVSSEALARQNGVLQLLRNVGRSIGPVIGAWSVARFGMLSSVGIYVLILMICSLCALALSERAPLRSDSKSGRRRHGAVLRVVLGNAVVMAYIVVGALANASIQAFSVAVPFRSIAVAGQNATYYGLIQTSFQFGMLAAGVILGVCGLARKIVSSSLTVSVGILGMGVSYFGIAFSSRVWFMVGSAILCGIMLGWVSTFADTCWQLGVNEEVRGLTAGIVYATLSILRPVGAGVAGIITESRSASVALGVFGVLLLLCGVSVAVLRPFDAGGRQIAKAVS